MDDVGEAFFSHDATMRLQCDQSLPGPSESPHQWLGSPPSPTPIGLGALSSRLIQAIMPTLCILQRLCVARQVGLLTVALAVLAPLGDERQRDPQFVNSKHSQALMRFCKRWDHVLTWAEQWSPLIGDLVAINWRAMVCR